jgi:hypothetical protein
MPSPHVQTNRSSPHRQRTSSADLDLRLDGDASRNHNELKSVWLRECGRLRSPETRWFRGHRRVDQVRP